jgi:hypothetical protein
MPNPKYQAVTGAFTEYAKKALRIGGEDVSDLARRAN